MMPWKRELKKISAGFIGNLQKKSPKQTKTKQKRCNITVPCNKNNEPTLNKMTPGHELLLPNRNFTLFYTVGPYIS